MVKIVEVSLATLEAGAVVEAVDEAFRVIWDDLVDPNKNPEAKRSVTLKISVVPTSNATKPDISAEVKTSLAPYHPIAGEVYLSRQGGQIVASQVDPEQMTLDMRSEADLKEFPKDVKGESRG